MAFCDYTATPFTKKSDEGAARRDRLISLARNTTDAHVPLTSDDRAYMESLPRSNQCVRCGVYEGTIGGAYNGLACTRHKYCLKCWFGKDPNYGTRALEGATVRALPLVAEDVDDSNRWKGQPTCFGCAMRRPYRIVDFSDDSDVEIIELSDSDIEPPPQEG